jgi:hypothetical protein
MNAKKVRTFRLAVSIAVLLIMILFIFLTNRTCVLKTADAFKGHVNLSGWDVGKEIYALNGDWTFYPNEYTGSGKGIESPVFVEVPSSMKTSLYERSKGVNFGTYELNLDIDTPGQYMLFIPGVRSAYKVYVNGVLLGGVGDTGRTVDEENGVYQPSNYLINADGTALDIKIETSFFTSVNGGIVNDIYLGTVENIYRYSINQLINDILTVGMLIGFGIYPLLLVSRENKGKAGYYFAGFSIFSALFAITINPNAGLFFRHGIPLKFMVKAEFLAFILMMFCIYAFLVSVYPYDKKRNLTKIIAVIDGIYLVLIFMSGNKGMLNVVGNLYPIVLVINAVICFRVIVRSIAKKKVYAMLSLSGSFVFVLMGFLEIIASESGRNLRLYLKNDLYNIGLVVFVICHINIFLMEIDRAFENAALADRMEISYLHAQIAPHFLFNTLNNLYVLMSSDIEKAKDLLMNLSQFLKVKYRFDCNKFDDYKLGDEIGFLKSYTDIENYRKQGNIRLQFDFDGEKILGDEEINEDNAEKKWYEKVKFQPMILQPLVENAIRHGYKSEPLDIRIQVKRADGYLEFLVEDNGAGMPEMQVKMLNKVMSHGVGVQNINYRLSKYCGERLHFDSTPGMGTRIKFRYRMEETV